MNLVDFRIGAALVIFVLTYAALAAGRLPYFKVDRPGAAMIGAVAMLVCGVLSRHQALAAVDFPTIALLFGMMIIVAYLRLCGAFAWLARRILARRVSAFSLLALTIALSGTLAAFFINDVVCLVLTPIVIDAAAESGVSPVPLLLALATASNIGSAATVAGNPQNMIVANFAGLSYAKFAFYLAPAAILGLFAAFAIIALAYRTQLGYRSAALHFGPSAGRLRVCRALAVKATVASLAVVAGFALGFSTSLVALSAAAALLLIGHLRPERVYRVVDWPLLLMFVGLFVVVGGAEHTGFQNDLVRFIGAERLANPLTLAVAVSVLSNVVSNVPAVMLFKPVFHFLGSPSYAGLLLASVSTYAGNLTVMGSIANLIVVESARRRGVRIGFFEYLRVGAPIALLTTAIDLAWLGVFH
jgi:Na+/H+ antiporter NhaD/arsenite permease-like protein